MKKLLSRKGSKVSPRKKTIVKKPARPAGGPARATGGAVVRSKSMPSVSGEWCFWVNNGPILSNLKDLSGALHSMSDDQFKHHVNKEKNDFAIWLRGALSERELAHKVVKSKNRQEFAKAIDHALKKYE
jgi:hypothetical protein